MAGFLAQQGFNLSHLGSEEPLHVTTLSFELRRNLQLKLVDLSIRPLHAFINLTFKLGLLGNQRVYLRLQSTNSGIDCRSNWWHVNITIWCQTRHDVLFNFRFQLLQLSTKNRPMRWSSWFGHSIGPWIIFQPRVNCFAVPNCVQLAKSHGVSSPNNWRWGNRRTNRTTRHFVDNNFTTLILQHRIRRILARLKQPNSTQSQRTNRVQRSSLPLPSFTQTSHAQAIHPKRQGPCLILRPLTRRQVDRTRFHQTSQSRGVIHSNTKAKSVTQSCNALDNHVALLKSMKFTERFSRKPQNLKTQKSRTSVQGPWLNENTFETRAS